MNERVIQFRIGVVVVAAVLITGILVFLFGEGRNVFQRQFTVTIRFPEAPNVSVDTPVRKSGIRIGRVSEVELLDDGGVDLTLRIDRNRTLRNNEICRIGTGSLVTGDAILEFVLATDAQLIQAGFDKNDNRRIDDEERAATREPINDGDYLRNGIIAVDPLTALAAAGERVPDAVEAIQGTGEDISELVRNLNEALGGNQDQFRRIVNEAEDALRNLNETMRNVNGVIGDPKIKEGLERTLTSLPEFFDQAQNTLVAAQETLLEFQKVSQRAEQNLANFEEFTRPLGERGEEIATSISGTLENVEDVSAQIKEVVGQFGNNQGTLARLLKDPELYDRVLSTVKNVEKLTLRLEPILNDVRILTDRVSRDPGGQLKRALDKRPPLAGSKFLTE